MSQENLEIVRRAVNALNEGDVDGYLALCSADIELASPVASIEGANKGADGIREFFSGVREAMNISAWTSKSCARSTMIEFSPSSR